jgi:SAM-dependent methyltransferase
MIFGDPADGCLMNKNPAKDFGPIADDYAFFETQSTEPEEDSRAYVEQLGPIVPKEGAIRILDFGCGSGTFTARFLQQAGWPAARLRLTLVEPVESARRQAVARLARFSQPPIVDSAALRADAAGSFDVVLANHCLYYVPQLEVHLAALIAGLSTAGVFVTAIAPRSNALIEFWTRGFGLLAREIPYNLSEDIASSLERLGIAFERRQVPYELVFPDTEDNRMRIIRFLLAEHLAMMPRRPLLDLFDQHAESGSIKIRTACDHYTIRPQRATR